MHEVAVGRTKEKSIRFDLKKYYEKHNIRFYNEELWCVKPFEKVVLTKTRKISYDYIILAIGGVTNYCGIKGMKEHSFDIWDYKSIQETIRKETEKSRFYKEKNNIIVCGAGLTGIELAAELIERTKANILLVEACKDILPGLKKAEKTVFNILKNKGVHIMTNTVVSRAEKGVVYLRNNKKIYAGTIIWCGGIKANPVNQKTGLRTNNRGLIMTNEYLQSSNASIYSVGDCAYQYKNPQPTTAQTAIQEGRTAANNILLSINNKDKEIFRQKNQKYLVSLGRWKGVYLEKTLRTGIIPAIIKKLVEKTYVFKHILL